MDARKPYGRSAQSRIVPVPLAPSPASTVPQASTPAATAMPYACQSCVRKKVKCDRVSPICSSCQRSKLECVYIAPPPPRRRPRKRDANLDPGSLEQENKRLRSLVAQYSRILQDHRLLSEAFGGSQPEPGKTSASPYAPANSENDTSASPLDQSEDAKEQQIGTLLSADGKSRYVASRVWMGARDADIFKLSDLAEDEDSSLSPPGSPGPIPRDPISDALLGASHDLLAYHPQPQDALRYWNIYRSNFEPMCKILHGPTAAAIVQKVAQNPAAASRAQECLAFSIYHAAITSLTDEECMEEFGQPKVGLLSVYRYAVRQALVNASWLKTIDMLVMQAYVMFLIVMRTAIDPSSIWILSGVAVRIAQRMGLHRDGGNHGLCPYDIEMRRRLFWQVLPLDGFSGQISGSGISIAPGSWDTKQPLNINDDQIYPGMEQAPVEQEGATEMMFVLARAALTNLFMKTGVVMKDFALAIQLKDGEELNTILNATEDAIEKKYLRYCDIGNPLHLMTLGVVRAAVNTLRLHNRIVACPINEAKDEEMKELSVVAQRILDTDNAMHNNVETKRYHWMIRSMYMWEALKCVLSALARPGLYSRAETDATWAKMEEFYSHHPEVIESDSVVHSAVCKLTLHAWDTNPPMVSVPEPTFITTFRARYQPSDQKVAINLEQPVDFDSAPVDLDLDMLERTTAGLDMEMFPNLSDWMSWSQPL